MKELKNYMKIAIIGPGAIGGLIAAYLKQAGGDVFVVGRTPAIEAINKTGIVVSGCRGDLRINLPAYDRLTQKVDLIILAVKTQDIKETIEKNSKYFKDALIITTQNGLRAEEIVAEYTDKEKIISTIVMFGATYLEPGKVTHNFEGKWVIGRYNGRADEVIKNTANVLGKIFPIVVSDNIQGMKWLKVFVNANNCIPACLGLSMQECFSDTRIGQIGMRIWQEGLRVVQAAGRELVSLPDFGVEKITRLADLPPIEGAKIYAGIMAGLSKQPLYGSILQSIKRGRPSEIDYINGEFVRLAKTCQISAPINEKIVELVHQVENTGKFFSKEDFLKIADQRG
jgi:2-dehydropantoate 2-reductase